MNSTRDNAALYAMQVQVAYARAWQSPWPYLVALGWVCCPFLMATVLHPSDMIWAQAVIQGLDKPRRFTAQQLASGEMQTLFALLIFAGIQIVATTLFYRLVQMARPGERPAIPTLWVLAGFTGVLGDAVWVAFGQADLPGMIIGGTPVVLTVFAEWVVNGLGRDFVYSRATGAHPATN